VSKDGTSLKDYIHTLITESQNHRIVGVGKLIQKLIRKNVKECVLGIIQIF